MLVSKSEYRKGIFEMLLSGISYGFMGLFIKSIFALEPSIKAGELLALRFVLSSILLLIYFLFFRKSWKVSSKNLLTLAFLGGVLFMINASLYFTGMKLLPASLAVLLLYTYPVWVAVGAHFFLGEKISKADVASLPLTFLGLVLLVGLDFEKLNMVGVFSVLGAAFFYSLFILISGKYLKNVNGLTGSVYLHFFVALSACLLHLHEPTHVLAMVPTIWLPLLGLSIIGTIVPMLFFLHGIKKIRKSDASILNVSEPVTGVIIGVLLLGERLSLVQLSGGGIIIGVLIFLAKSKQTVRKA